MSKDEDSPWSVFEALRKKSQEKRAENRENSAEILRQAGIEFTSYNHGAHLKVIGPKCVIDFWPGTGKWICCNVSGRGVYNLIRMIKE